MRGLFLVRTVFWPQSYQHLLRGSINRHGKINLLFPGGKTGDVNYSNHPAINPDTGFLAMCFLTDCHYATGEATVSLPVYNGCNWFILVRQSQLSSPRRSIIPYCCGYNVARTATLVQEMSCGPNWCKWGYLSSLSVRPTVVFVQWLVDTEKGENELASKFFFHLWCKAKVTADQNCCTTHGGTLTIKCAIVHDGVSTKRDTCARWVDYRSPHGTFLPVKCWSVDGKAKEPSVMKPNLNN